MKPERGIAQALEKRRKTSRAGDPTAPTTDPRLIALVRLLARHAALQDHQQALRDAANGAIPDDSSPGKKP